MPGGGRSLAECAQRHDAATEALAAGLAALGVATIDEARRAAAKRTDLANDLRAETTTVEGLGDGTALAELSQLDEALAGLDARIARAPREGFIRAEGLEAAVAARRGSATSKPIASRAASVCENSAPAVPAVPAVPEAPSAPAATHEADVKGLACGLSTKPLATAQGFEVRLSPDKPEALALRALVEGEADSAASTISLSPSNCAIELGPDMRGGGDWGEALGDEREPPVGGGGS